MKLHVESAGHGPHLVLVHGWGVNSGVWHTVLPALTQHFRVTCVDLPGHGGSRERPMSRQLEAVADDVLSVTPAEAIWLGWSLGGMVCLQIALLAPARMRALILSNTTPRFTATPGWDYAMPVPQIDAFMADLERDFAGTVQKFLALQVLGDEHARDTLRTLRENVLARGKPDRDSLAAGMEILRRIDLREASGRVGVPTLVLAGEYDRLTPPQAGSILTELLVQAEYFSFSRTAHAPFISHPAEFVHVVSEFVYRQFPDLKHEQSR